MERQRGPAEAPNHGTPATPRPAASVVLLRRGGKHAQRALEVLLLKRTEKAAFMPGAWVFPGGSVDPADGEGPIHQVRLSPFRIARHAVSNKRFAAFVAATGHVTEAERYGWSFVFGGLLPDEMFQHYAIAGTEEQVAERIAEIVPLIDELIVHPVGSADCDVDDVAERVAAIWSSKVTSEGSSR